MPLILVVGHAAEEELLPERIRAFQLSHLRREKAMLRGLRRLLEEGASVLEIGQLSIDFGKKQGTFCCKPLPLTPIQFRLVISLWPSKTCGGTKGRRARHGSYSRSTSTAPGTK
jgi:hypothetical protein